MSAVVHPERRQPDETVHDFQHRLIEERKTAWRVLPRRSGLDKMRRREANKKAAWTLTGHLRTMHGVRANNAFLFKTWDEIEAMHSQLHPVQL